MYSDCVFSKKGKWQRLRGLWVLRTPRTEFAPVKGLCLPCLRAKNIDNRQRACKGLKWLVKIAY